MVIPVSGEKREPHEGTKKQRERKKEKFVKSVDFPLLSLTHGRKNIQFVQLFLLRLVRITLLFN